VRPQDSKGVFSPEVSPLRLEVFKSLRPQSKFQLELLTRKRQNIHTLSSLPAKVTGGELNAMQEK